MGFLLGLLRAGGEVSLNIHLLKLMLQELSTFLANPQLSPYLLTPVGGQLRNMKPFICTIALIPLMCYWTHTGNKLGPLPFWF